MIYGHGNNRWSYSDQIVADFSSNVWYKGPPPALICYLKSHLDIITDYPEPDAVPLKLKIAVHYQLKPSQILVTNGSTEAFYLIAQSWYNCSSLIIVPCFSEYEDACRLYHHSISFITQAQLKEKTLFPNQQIVWLANPNNPDGHIYSLDIIEQLLKENPQTFFVIDEAYLALCAGVQSAVGLLKYYSNLILVKSLTKVFAIPGLRVGFILGSEAVIAKIAENGMPWRVNAVAIEAGKYLCDRYQKFVPSVGEIVKETEYLQCQIRNTGMFEVYPSVCNFFLIRSLSHTAAELKSFLIRDKGILIRDASNFKSLNDSYSRIAIQGPAKNQLLIEGINNWLQTL